jgi:chromosome segregation ATPase
MHKWFVVGALAVGACVVAKHTSALSYAGTIWSQVKSHAKQQIPTRLEIERARHEIGRLDQDIAGMVRPLAEHKAAIGQLDKEIDQTETNLSERRQTLLRLTEEIESKPRTIRVGDRDVSLDRARASLERDFAGFKRLETHVETLRKLREAKQTAFDGARDQLAKLISKKRDFELRLAQLEADEETLRVADLGSKIAIDDNRASTIEASLREIERRHQVHRAQVELSQGDLVTDLTPPAPKTDLAGIRAHLEQRPTSAAVASAAAVK